MSTCIIIIVCLRYAERSGWCRGSLEPDLQHGVHGPLHQAGCEPAAAARPKGKVNSCSSSQTHCIDKVDTLRDTLTIALLFFFFLKSTLTIAIFIVSFFCFVFFYYDAL